MVRNTKADGGSWTREQVDRVWRKGHTIHDQSPEVAKRDRCGALIKRSDYGEMVKTGWEIDHIIPVSKGGTDDLSNLRPLQWENNRAKGDSLDGDWSCAVS